MVVYKNIGNGIVHAYSDAGRKIVGGEPYGTYSEAYDPEDAHRTYEESDEYVPTYIVNPSPYRRFSKLSLESVLFQAGLLDAVDAFIDAQVVTNEKGQTQPLRRFYNTANDFSEDHPLFTQYRELLKQNLGLSDEDVENILSKSVAC